MSGVSKKLFLSYTQGVAKSMDGQNKVNIFNNVRTPATIASAWKDVGKELDVAMNNILVDAVKSNQTNLQEAIARVLGKSATPMDAVKSNQTFYRIGKTNE